MRRLTRRKFIKKSLATAAGAGIVSGLPGRAWSQVLGANSDIRVAIVGLGGDRLRQKVHTSFTVQGGKGGHMIKPFRDIEGVRVVAICDPDKFNIGRDVKRYFSEEGQKVDTYTDVREVLGRKDIDAVYVATPNHWHGLITVWACQAGKDVYVEKPVSWSIWEGRQMVKAARKYDRIVQGGMGARSDTVVQQWVEWLRAGNLGKIKLARAVCYRYRPSMGKVSGPQPIPETVDYDLWCGPGPKGPLMRENLHYDWHWVWAYGNGEISNLGSHFLDKCYLAIGADKLPKRVVSVGGRFGYEDDGQTANTQITYFDCEKAPILWELRALPAKPGATYMDNYKGVRKGEIIHCEGGYVAGGWAYDNEDKKIRQFVRKEGENHVENFIKAVRSRKPGDLNAEILSSHLSVSLCHMGNISHRLGQQATPDEIQASIKEQSEVADAFERMKEHLVNNGIDAMKDKAVLGAWLTMDGSKEEFVGAMADKANKLLKREQYRKGFVFPEEV